MDMTTRCSERQIGKRGLIWRAYKEVMVGMTTNKMLAGRLQEQLQRWSYYTITVARRQRLETVWIRRRMASSLEAYLEIPETA
jgi:bacteriorhodopsin